MLTSRIMKLMRALRRRILTPVDHLLSRSQSARVRGTRSWLIGMEYRFGGYVNKVPRNKVSASDHRTREQLSKGGMIGGDRMGIACHNYAGTYAKYLRPFLSQGSLTLVEAGILKGSGLAIWSELFPQGRIIGLDIDLGHTKANMENLKSAGAFGNGEPELYEFDQLQDDNAHVLGNLLQGDRISIFIDDGLHSNEAILKTLSAARPHLAERFVYFIEDNDSIYTQLVVLYPSMRVFRRGKMTVLTSV